MSNDKIEITIPKIEEGKGKRLVNVGGNYILSELEENNPNEFSDNYVEQATYDSAKLSHIYNKMLETDMHSYITTPERLTMLAQNTQNFIYSINEINGIVKYYINKEDLVGRIVETIENNINTNFSINYPIPATAKKKDQKMLAEMKKVIDNFNKQIDIPKLIFDNAVSAYTQGNYIYYLIGDSKKGYSIVNYPLIISEITPMKVDGDNVIAINVNELVTRLQVARSKYMNLKSNDVINIGLSIEDEIKRDYPIEVYNAYQVKDRYAFLNPQKVGLTKINSLKGLYGLTPIFKSLSAQLMLETLDNADRKVIMSKTKKVFFQSTRKELMGNDFSKPMQTNPVGYAHASLLQSMGQEVCVYTGMPFVENLQILEPKTELTDTNTRLAYKIRVLEALGISFISSQGANSITTTKINYSELLKTVNKITSQLKPVINKYYQFICEENGFPLEYSPTIKIESTDLIDLDSKLKLIETLYSKIGVSYDTVLRKLDLDPTTEISKRVAENNYEVNGVKMTMDDVMSPHITSFTARETEKSANTNNNLNTDTNSNGSKKSENIDKNESDQQRQEAIN